MFDIEEFIEDIKEEKKAEKSYETGLPPSLQTSLMKYKNALEKIKKEIPYNYIDCDFCELQSEINCAEADQEISSLQADYLRRTYLYDE